MRCFVRKGPSTSAREYRQKTAMQLLLLLACVADTLCTSHLGHPAIGGLPRAWSYGKDRALDLDRTPTPVLELPLANPVAYLERHRQSLGLNARNVLHIAPEGWEETDMVDRGAWTVLPDGTCLWRLSILSQGTSSHILIFSELALPPGGDFSIYSPGFTRNRTSCGSSCLRVRPETMLSSKLTSLAMQGEEVILEYHHPEAQPPTQGFVARIISIMQGLPAALPQAAERAKRRRQLLVKAQEATYTPGTGFDMGALQQRTDLTAQCTPSARCDPSVESIADAVVAIYAINVKLGAMAMCTGTLVTAPLNRKYLLTADHCFVDKTAINNFEYWVLIFNYEAPCGSEEAPDITYVSQGVQLLFYDSRADVLLLDIVATIPDHFEPYLLGYDAKEHYVPKRALGIHHPNGNIKRISYANTSASISTSFVARRFPEGEIQPSNATHLQITWSSGATASGSSGSPLINMDTGRVIGVLTGGLASCDDPSQPDYYGRLSAAYDMQAWEGGLEYFLSDAPGGKVLDQVAEILTAPTNGGKIVRRAMNSMDLPPHGPTLALFPNVLTFNPARHHNSVNYVLTDPILNENETIFVNVSVFGAYPGNVFDMTPYVHLSDYNDTFTSRDAYTYCRTIQIATTGLEAVQAAAGFLVRFLLIFTLTSDQDPDYMHLHTMKGILTASPEPWTAFAPDAMRCSLLPCHAMHPGRSALDDSSVLADSYSSTVNLSYDAPQLAIYSFTPAGRTKVCVDVCLEPGILTGATVSIYIDKKFTWTLIRDPFGDSNCIHIASTTVQPNETYSVVVSDENNFDAVLPMRLVNYITVKEIGAVASVGALQLGPIGNSAAASVATKTMTKSLPANALSDGTPLPQPQLAPALLPGFALVAAP